MFFVPKELIIGAASVLLALTLYFRKKQASRAVLVTKSTLSLLFIVAACSAPPGNIVYFRFVALALTFGLIGDVALALNGERAFFFGLLAFLLGHILYIISFYAIAAPNSWTVSGHLFSLGVGSVVCFWLWKYLGKKKVWVALYIAAIGAMVGGAWTVFGEAEQTEHGRFAVLLGATLIYLSDIFVARNRFFKPEFINRLIGLPLYYGGQFLLAFSIHWII